MKVDAGTIEEKTGVDLLERAVNYGSTVHINCGNIDFKFEVTYTEYTESRTSYYPGGTFYENIDVELISAFYYDSEDNQYEITDRIELVFHSVDRVSC